MSARPVQHSDYQQLASRIADLNETLKAMESELHTPSTQRVAQSNDTGKRVVVETPLAIAAG